LANPDSAKYQAIQLKRMPGAVSEHSLWFIIPDHCLNTIQYHAMPVTINLTTENPANGLQHAISLLV